MFSIMAVNYTNSLQPTPAPYIKIYESDKLSSLGVFISSILLSAGGLFAIIFAWINKSRCSSIKCGS
jgi:hypothetical protein